MNTYYVKGNTPFSVFVIKTTDMDRDEFKANLRAGNFKFTEVAQNGMEFNHVLKYKKKVPRATGSCFKCLIEHEGDMKDFLYEMRNESTAETQQNKYGSITFVRPTPAFLERKWREQAEAAAEFARRHPEFNHNRHSTVHNHRPTSTIQSRPRHTTSVRHVHHHHRETISVCNRPAAHEIYENHGGDGE